MKTPANDIESARKHHKQHGDMDGHTCLLAECALHYLNETTMRGLFLWCAKVALSCDDCPGKYGLWSCTCPCHE